jgi:drug/metabolite transporter (DMT)-like permease
MPYAGELAALSTALLWSGSSLLFALATRRVGGLAVNQFRLLLAVPFLLALHLLLLGTAWPALPGQRLWLLVVSGVSGLVIGDIGYFYALGVIGPRVSAVLMATWPAFATGIGWAWDGVPPSLPMVAGIGITMSGVMMVLLRGGDGASWNAAVSPWKVRLAILGALLGALGQAFGSVLVAVAARAADDLPAGLPGVSCALVRMVAASLGIVAVAALRGQAGASRAVLRDPKALGAALGGTACGPVLGVWLSMVALGFGPIGVVATLMATTPVFLLPIARVVYGARIPAIGVLGTLLAVAGVAVLLLNKAPH